MDFGAVFELEYVTYSWMDFGAVFELESPLNTYLPRVLKCVFRPFNLGEEYERK